MEEMKLPLVLGGKLNGEELLRDLRKMPHLLIGGQTGYGKSNLLINIIEGLISVRTPEEVKFLLVDPKRVEFYCLKDKVKDYLYQPIPADKGEAYMEIEDSYKAISELCYEMDNRYTLLKRNRCRSIEEYNSKSEYIIPYIVLIIDEYADLVYLSSQFECNDDEQDLEDDSEDVDNEDEGICRDTFMIDIARLGMLGRMVGIHVILSTQRPTYEVITGMIKANYPARISFKVPGKRYSKIILDRTGAELLKSPGDFILIDELLNVEFAHAPLNPLFC